MKVLSLTDVKGFLNSQTTQSVELLGLTPESPKRATSFKLSGGGNVSANLTTVDLSLTTRAEHPKLAEEDCYEWFFKLNKKTNFQIGNTKCILVRSTNVPTYLGEYENGLFYFMVSFQILMEVQ
jgi:hypothetical protein